ncbi:MAG: TIGR02530 family flagellar biosynthesis protein [Clostridium sp.]
MSRFDNIYHISSTSNNQLVNKKALDVRVNHRLDFEKCVNNAIDKSLKFSSHANERLNSRNINLSKSDMNNINKAIDKVKQKGSKEALIIYNDLALIASVQNRTIITAMDKDSLDEKIFTNIDSAIII